MLTSKQRAFLRGLATDLPATIQVGKEGTSETGLNGFRQYLSKRELVKANVLKTCPMTPREVAEWTAEQLGADVVNVIGRKFVIYLPNEDLREKGQAIILPY